MSETATCRTTSAAALHAGAVLQCCPANSLALETFMQPLHVTVLFVGLFAIIQIPLTIMVGFRRARTGIQFFDGGDQPLLRRMRAHGNYTETVPMVLLAMGAAEVTSMPPWALWAGGTSLLVGRIMRAAILVAKGWGNPRAIGMILTLVPMACFGGWCIYRAIAA